MIDDFYIDLKGNNQRFPLDIEILDNGIKITINKDMSFDVFLSELEQKTKINYENHLNREFFIKNDLLKRNNKIFLFKNQDVTIILFSSLEMSMKFCVCYKENKDYIRETVFSGEKKLWNKTSTFEFSDCLYISNNLYESFYKAYYDGYEGNLEHKDALNLIKKLINKLEIYSFKEISINYFYRIVNLSQHYNIIRKDDAISLSWRKTENNDNIHETKEAKFDIILNDTSEVVGEIAFDYNRRKNGIYFGNVSYEVYPSFRNNGYASRALNLLKQIVQTNNTLDRDLFISVKQSNKFSSQVAIKNGGELCYSGKIPEDVAYLEDD